MVANKIVLVTGANRGIGLAIVKDVAGRSEPFTILATSRKGEDLKLIGTHPNTKILYPQLDITNSESVATIQQQVRGLGGLDVLINNAGEALEFTDEISPRHEVYEKTLDLIYYGTTKVTDALLSHIHKGGRVVFLSSAASQQAKFDNPDLRSRVDDPKLSRAALDGLVDEYKAALATANPGDGWLRPGEGFLPVYGMAKAFINLLTRILARERPDLLINCGCPGAVRTNEIAAAQMPIKWKTPEQGAALPLRLAFGDIGSTTGKYWAGQDNSDLEPGQAFDDWMGREIIMVPAN